MNERAVQAVVGWDVAIGYCKVVECAQLKYIFVWRYMHSK